MAVTINGHDLAPWGFAARSAPGLLSAPTMSHDPVPVYDQPGARVGPRRIGTRPFQVEGLFTAQDLATARTNLDRIVGLVGRREPLELVFAAWSTGRRLVAEGLGVLVEPMAPMFGLVRYDVRLLFDAPDPPFWEAIAETTVGGLAVGAPVNLPMGNAGAPLRVRIQGPMSTAVRLALVTVSSSTAAFLHFGPSWAGGAPTSSEWLVLDMGRQTARRNDTGSFDPSAGASVLGDLTDGEFFTVRPQHYAHESSGWARLELAGSTGAIATVTYRARWY